MDDKTPQGCTGALRSQRARPTTFAGPNIGIGAVAMTSAAVVEGLTCGTDIAIAFGQISKPLGTVERAVLSVNTVAGSHIMRDAPIRQPLQELPVPARRVCRHRFWLSPLPVRETREHVLRGHVFLAHSRRPCLHSHDHAALIVDE